MWQRVFRVSLYVALGALAMGFLAFLLVPSLRYRLQPSQSVTVVPTPQGRTASSPSQRVPLDLDIVTVLPRDAIRAISEPRFATAEEAQVWMRPDTPVLGVSIGGEQKAYPLPVLSRHEIVNDVVGGEPVAVTW